MQLSYKPLLAFLLAALVVFPAQAQHNAAVASVKDHFRSAADAYRASADDLAELVVTDAYVGRRTGATYVYLQQAHRGVPVVNAPAQAVVTGQGNVFGAKASFSSNLAQRVSAEQPRITPEAAAAVAAAHIRSNAKKWHIEHSAITDGPEEPTSYVVTMPGPDFLDFEQDSDRLVYYAVEGGGVHLAWEVALASRDGQHYFIAYVDAVESVVLEWDDLVVHDHWGYPVLSGDELTESFTPFNTQQPALAPRGGAPEYGVFPVPLISPSDGTREIVVDPANAEASPLGWHDTGSESYTITRGNNTHTYADTDPAGSPGQNQPDPGSEPDGGAELSFLYPLDFELDPIDNQEAALTNLFYWTNIVHDVIYQYGLDEAAGNYQVSNFGNGGNEGDPILAEGQDGSSINNANFFPSSDGVPGRMQMFLWDGANPLRVTAPASLEGTYTSVISATFGPQGSAGDLTGDLVLADGDTTGTLLCDPPTAANATELSGNIALIERGGCNFTAKVKNAQDVGAIGAIVYNCEPGAETCSEFNPGENIFGMGGDDPTVTIPSYMVRRSDGLAFVGELPGVTIEAEGEDVPLDGDFDNGVIVHEYGHGISNRLTGGPNTAVCLRNDEQMGEGWSDYYGLMLSMKPGDSGSDARGIATYLSLQGPDGAGIRNGPYSTDFTVNGRTYEDLPNVRVSADGSPVPHDVGEIWALMIWEMTWELIEGEGLGFSPDFYDADGGFGNQIALNLVTEGMKLQGCSPGFVDGRDGILAADTLLYDGQYSDAIWEAFARRGLGFGADQGSSNDWRDGTADFSLPSEVANEPTAGLPGGFQLSAAYPNPFRQEANLKLEVATPQAVRLEVYDMLGRRVALLHDGDLAAGREHVFTLSGAALSSGVYTVRAVGDSFTASSRVTLMK